ncbi:hypothetical protein ACFV2X_37995 [Streptomyces sp. NPDC059679]|uniref:hypothetical protein n=1 Tax=Streptomyces sp. NPDC059679 TaxID=3346903 RepID=UPI00368E90F3
MSDISDTEQPSTDEPTTEDDPESGTPAPQPSTEPPVQPSEPFTFQPYMWYSATCACATNTCTNYNVIQEVPMMYSNNGTNVVIYCGLCSKRCTILSAALLSPQPPEE